MNLLINICANSLNSDFKLVKKLQIMDGAWHLEVTWKNRKRYVSRCSYLTNFAEKAVFDRGQPPSNDGFQKWS